MKTMSVLEIDQHWPEAERALKADLGIVVTRDGETIGKLVPADASVEKMKEFDWDERTPPPASGACDWKITQPLHFRDTSTRNDQPPECLISPPEC